MTDEEKNLLVDVLTFYRDERELDNLPMDSNFKYYDIDECGNRSYQTTDAKIANNLANLIEMFS